MLTRISHLRVALVGLGFVGQPLALEFDKTEPGVALDVSATRIVRLQAGILGFKLQVQRLF